MRVDNSARSGGLIRISSIFYNMKVYCLFSFESPHRGDSNEYTQYTIFIMKTKNNLNYPKSAAIGFFSKRLKNEFETAVVNEPSVFEPLKFYCRLKYCLKGPLNPKQPTTQMVTCTIHSQPVTRAGEDRTRSTASA